jgi:alkylation response protein AidB-like acyl-CoA dehydrogenase
MLARDYAHRRESFGKKIVDHPLHMQTLARLEVSLFLFVLSQLFLRSQFFLG